MKARSRSRSRAGNPRRRSADCRRQGSAQFRLCAPCAATSGPRKDRFHLWRVGKAGPLSIVTLSKGSKDGLEVGHVLAVLRSQSSARYELRTSPLFGRQGLSGNDRPRPYYAPELSPRDAPLYKRPEPVTDAQIAKLPDERYGLVMVFRTFDRAAFGIVMQASRPVALNDFVTNPDRAPCARSPARGKRAPGRRCRPRKPLRYAAR